MNLEQVKALSDEALDALVADLVMDRVVAKDGVVWWFRKGSDTCGLKFAPRFSSDLNEMHGAEKMVGGVHDQRWGLYCKFLEEVVGGGSQIAATARQRAEALVWLMEKT